MVLNNAAIHIHHIQRTIWPSFNIYRAEAFVLCGRYAEARRELEQLSEGEEVAPVSKMAVARLAFLSALIGQGDVLDDLTECYDTSPNSDAPFLEAWERLDAQGSLQWWRRLVRVCEDEAEVQTPQHMVRQVVG